MIELAHLAEQLKELIEHAPVPVMMVLVPGFIVAVAVIAIAVATLIEQQLPTGQSDH